MEDNLTKLANIARKFSDLETLAYSIETYDEKIETVDELIEMLSDELDYSGW